MANLIVFNKPWGVLCQFSGASPTLADYIKVPGVYPAGRLDKDSEGLVLLTDSGALQARISQPKSKMDKTYWVQVEGIVSDSALKQLARGVKLRDKGGKTWTTAPASVKRLSSVPLPARQPPIRYRASVPDMWLEITLQEGKNRQVRRMTAAVGHPCLRLYRYRVGPWHLTNLSPGHYRTETVHLPDR